MRTSRDEWCDRVASALADGRFVEDPSFYRPHLSVCEDCRAATEGLLVLQGLLERAREEGPNDGAGVRSPELVVQAAIASNRTYCRRRNSWIAAGVIAFLLVGVAHFTDTFRDPLQVQTPVERAEQMHRLIFPVGESPRYELLRTDARLRGGYLVALGDSSSLVRRTALHALAFSGVPLPGSAYESVLSRAEEDLETPLSIASLSDGSRALVEALEARRTATLMSVLSGLTVAASRGEAEVHPKKLLPFLLHERAEVRLQTLLALEYTRNFRPGEEVDRMLRRDASPQVREKAGGLLLKRGGDGGSYAVLAYLRHAADWEVEQSLASALVLVPGGRELAMERVVDQTTPVRNSISYLRALGRAAETAQVAPVVERALTGSDATAWAALADLCAQTGLTAHRDTLQDCWRRASASSREDLALILAKWDLACAAEGPLGLTLELVEGHRGFAPLLEVVQQLSRSANEGVARRAQVLLNDWPKK